MHAQIVNPFLSATTDLFSNMFGLEVSAGSPYELETHAPHEWEISGVLGVTGGHQGLLAFRLPRLVAEELLKKSGVDIPDEAERKDLVNNMVGELTNIIAGNAAVLFESADIDISPPIVVLGKHHEITWPRGIEPVVGIPFSTSFGQFEINVCVK